MDLTERFGTARLLTTEPWHMSMGERAYLVLLLSQFRPRFAVEVGSGASTVVLTEFSERVVVVDPTPSDLLAGLSRRRGRRRGLKVVRKPSQTHLARVMKPEVDFVLIDGDHDPAVVRSDIETVLASRPSEGRLLLMHDVGDEACRSGIEAVDWDGCPWVHHVDLDVVLPPADNTAWGGFGIAHLYPEPRSS